MKYLRGLCTVVVLFTCFTTWGSAEIMERIHRLNWDGIEVVWLEDDRLPLFGMQVYFADGALSDHVQRRGETEFMFAHLSEGTRRYSASEIADYLEFFGAGYGGNVTHEYSEFRVSGLLQHMAPTVQMICHLFSDATFPRDRINNALAKRRTNLENSVRDHGWLASRAFRELSLRGTPFDYPTDGKIDDLQNITPSQLQAKRNYFNSEVAKRIYLTGPKDVLGLKNIIAQDCGWKSEEETELFTREVSYSEMKIEDGPSVFFVEVPESNQAQVRVGRFLNKGEYDDIYSMMLAGNFLGGGFTSRLMREVRVSRGLTYSISAIAAPQRDYGRALISTFTPTERVGELLQVIRDTIDKASTDIEREELERTRGFLIGSHPFSFESPERLLAQIMSLDHQQRSLDELTNFPARIKKVTPKSVKKQIASLFSYERQVIVVLGERKVLDVLEEAGFDNVTKGSFRDFL